MEQQDFDEAAYRDSLIARGMEPSAASSVAAHKAKADETDDHPKYPCANFDASSNC